MYNKIILITIFKFTNFLFNFLNDLFILFNFSNIFLWNLKVPHEVFAFFMFRLDCDYKFKSIRNVQRSLFYPTKKYIGSCNGKRIRPMSLFSYSQFIFISNGPKQHNNKVGSEFAGICFARFLWNLRLDRQRIKYWNWTAK